MRCRRCSRPATRRSCRPASSAGPPCLPASASAPSAAGDDVRTGKGGRYRYYTCSTKARQGETGCHGHERSRWRSWTILSPDISRSVCSSRSGLRTPRLRSRPSAGARRPPPRAYRRTEQARHRGRPAAEAALRRHRDRRRRSRRPALKDRIAGSRPSAIRPRPTRSGPGAARQLRPTAASRPPMLQAFARTARQRIRIEAAAIAATTCARSPSGSRSATARSESWDRKGTCCRRSPQSA